MTKSDVMLESDQAHDKIDTDTDTIHYQLGISMSHSMGFSGKRLQINAFHDQRRLGSENSLQKTLI